MSYLLHNPLLKKPVFNIQSWGIGKHIETIYTLETTKEEPELEEINYSNLYTEEFKSLESALTRLNYYQKLGYHNINLVATTYNTRSNKHIKEESINDLEITYNTREKEETDKENEQLRKQLAALQNKLNTHEAFINKYNVQKTFDDFEKEYNK